MLSDASTRHASTEINLLIFYLLFSARQILRRAPPPSESIRIFYILYLCIYLFYASSYSFLCTLVCKKKRDIKELGIYRSAMQLQLDDVDIDHAPIRKPIFCYLDEEEEEEKKGKERDVPWDALSSIIQVPPCEDW